ncbi:hypothetical protein [Moorena sp. SIO2C4]|uniref:hypothetical protein n=1 Tax=Moorena sp. SIO2C4 TaxID=2607824 RepID=UPI00257DCD5C|nr:hypothetical protein [Moorena sp. SIO2C4]
MGNDSKQPSKQPWSAHNDRIRGDRQENLKKAIVAYQLALMLTIALLPTPDSLLPIP